MQLLNKINKAMLKVFSYKKLLTITIALFLFFVGLSFSNTALALDEAQNRLGETAKNTKLDSGVGGMNVPEIIGRVVGVVLSFVGVIFLLLIIYAGFTWMLARGNEADVKKAKDLMYDAVIGLIIILAAYAITAFVGNALAS